LDANDNLATRYSGCVPFVVDDDKDFRLLLARAFAKAGIPPERLRMAEDGEEAIAFLQRPCAGALPSDLTPSLVVLDMNLPKKSGLEVLAWIREHPAFQDVLVFILSSIRQPEFVARAFQLRTDSYDVKPSDFNALQTVVEGMLVLWHKRAQGRSPRVS
jgi:CheY-like chemotaxis protein